MKFKTFLKSLVLLVGISATGAKATLIGNTIDVDNFLFTPSSATIGAGPEFDFLGLLSLDFDANTLTISDISQGFLSWGDFDFVTFSGFDSEIVSFDLLSNDGFSGEILNNYSYTADSITLDWYGEATAGAQLVFSIGLMQQDVDPIPEPGMLALMLLGLAGVARKTVRR